ncbi:MAG: ATP-binding protein [Firmicutes bacterium]|nr:ATP-binding protein [Bacillota bacterium]
MLGVFTFSVAIQIPQIKYFFYNQQARFYIYEAEEIVTYFGLAAPFEVISERLKLHSQFLGASIIITDMEGNHLYNQKAAGRPKAETILEHDFLQNIKEGRNIVFSGKLAGVDEDIFLVSVPLREKDQIKGSVIIYSPLSLLNQQIYKMFSIAVIGALIGIFLATILSIFISRKLAKPLVEMEEAARAIAGGDFGKQLDVSSEDEVGRLAFSLNRMSAELQEKIEAIERLDKVRQQFVSDVSHELRTPITVIQGFSEAVLDGLVNSKEQQEKYLKNIIDESCRLRRLVDDLLDLKAMEAGKTFDEMEYVVLNKLVNITAERLKQIASAKEIQIKTVVPSQSITVLGNIDRLKQVFTNMLDNAINHSKQEGTVTIELGLKGDFAFVAVKDAGPGIPPEEMESIWERFYKIDKSRSRRGAGTGLGLSIVKKIVEMHGGEVNVESNPGQGAVFTVFLPVSQ